MLRDRLLVLHPHGRAGTGNLQTPVGCCCPGSGRRHAGRCGVGNVPLYYLGWGEGDLVLQGLMQKAAPAGQGGGSATPAEEAPSRREFVYTAF